MLIDGQHDSLMFEWKFEQSFRAASCCAYAVFGSRMKFPFMATGHAHLFTALSQACSRSKASLRPTGQMMLPVDWFWSRHKSLTSTVQGVATCIKVEACEAVRTCIDKG